ncbi:peptidoglycan-binding domain-containing protein [Micromonospora sp. M12]
MLAVEQALQAQGLLNAQWVDGYFGTVTVSAYAAYQRSLGYTGLAANGLPGTTSLTKLGQNRYTVGNTIGPGARFRATGTSSTPVRRRCWPRPNVCSATPWCWSRAPTTRGDPTSAGTHDGGAWWTSRSPA